MTRRELAFVACRIMAVWMFCNWISMIPAVFQSPYDANHLFNMSILFYMVPTGFVAVALWKLAPMLSRHMAWRGEIDDEDGEENAAPDAFSLANLESAMSLAFSMVGMYLLINAIPRSITVVGSYVMGPVQSGRAISKYELASCAIQTGLALWVLLGSRGIAYLVLRARKA